MQSTSSLPQRLTDADGRLPAIQKAAEKRPIHAFTSLLILSRAKSHVRVTFYADFEASNAAGNTTFYTGGRGRKRTSDRLKEAIRDRSEIEREGEREGGQLGRQF